MKNKKLNVQLKEYLKKIIQDDERVNRIMDSTTLDKIASLYYEFLHETSSEDPFDIETHKKIKSLFKDAVLKIISDREDFLITSGD